MSLKNLNVRKKITLAIVLVTILASVSGIVGAFMMHNVDSQYREGMVKYGFAQGDVGRLMANFCRLDGNIHDAIGYLNTKDAGDAQRKIGELTAQLDNSFDEVEKTLVTDEGRANFKESKDAWGDYKTLSAELVQIAVNSSDPALIQQVQQRLVNELDVSYMGVYNNMLELLDTKVSDGQNMEADVNRLYIISLTIIIALIAAALLLGFVIASRLSKGIAQPLARCVERLQALAHGDLHSPLPEIDSQDEIGKMVEASRTVVEDLKTVIEDIGYLLGQMAEGNFDIVSRNREAYVGDLQPVLHSIRKIKSSLSDTLAHIIQSADQVSSGAEQVSNSAQALAQGATEQASAVEELSATVTEITQGAMENVQLAQESRRLSNEAGSQVTVCSGHMEDMVSSMKEIKEASEEVREIIDTIENIAFQTNILALNAAVEAARAGAAGKGFAVVADEVRNLASKSDQAAKATKDRIENAIAAVRKGSQYVSDVSTALELTMELAGKAVTQMGEIAAASEHQAESVDQVREGIDQISAVVQNNSATSEETAAASEELSSQAQIMDQLMSRFQLSQTDGFASYNRELEAGRASQEMSGNQGGYEPSTPSEFGLGSKY